MTNETYDQDRIKEAFERLEGLVFRYERLHGETEMGPKLSDFWDSIPST
jgi:hypothetical protein